MTAPAVAPAVVIIIFPDCLSKTYSEAVKVVAPTLIFVKVVIGECCTHPVIAVWATAVIWVPAALILLGLGNWGAALFIFIWGFVAIGSIDNIARPFLIGGKAHTYPLMTFLVVLGGVITMGLKGVIIGPLVLIVLMSFLHIYESEYARLLKK